MYMNSVCERNLEAALEECGRAMLTMTAILGFQFLSSLWSLHAESWLSLVLLALPVYTNTASGVMKVSL